MTPRAELMFENQIDAAMKLAEILPATVIKNDNFLIIAQSLESLPIANHLALKLGLAYEFLFT